MAEENEKKVFGLSSDKIRETIKQTLNNTQTRLLKV